MPGVAVIIPACNEAGAIARVIAAVPEEFRGRVLVVDNNSTDGTPEIARKAGAHVLREERQGYGYACLKGVEYLKGVPDKPDVVVFLDGDYADYPEEMGDLVKPLASRDYDMVLGSRIRGQKLPGALMPWQEAGNRLITLLIRVLYKTSFTDLGPFRAVRFEKLAAMDMRETGYGWTVEMQLKAVKQGLRILEIPVRYRPRIGKSKISGSIKASLRAGYRIVKVIFKLRAARAQ